MNDPSLLTALASSIEASANLALKYDPATRAQLAAIDDILAIEFTFPPMTLYFSGNEEGLSVMGHCELPVTTGLKGSPLALVSLLRQPTSLANSGVELTGSVGLLQQWQTVFSQLDIDWEDAISSVLGDYLGPLSASGIRKSAEYSRDQGVEHLRLLKEYLPEELKAIPNKLELDGFYQAVGDIKNDVERFEAKLERLKNKIQEQQKDSSL